MRISENEKSAILTTVYNIDPDAHVWLFGSRTDDTKQGGDFDILIESKRIAFKEKQLIRVRIQDLIGEQKIDLLVVSDLTQNTDPFVKSILPGAIRL